MGVLFSVVKLTANDKTGELLAGGIPKSPEELQGWFKFWDFVNEIDEDDVVKVRAEGYIYGGDETFMAGMKHSMPHLKRLHTLCRESKQTKILLSKGVQRQQMQNSHLRNLKNSNSEWR